VTGADVRNNVLSLKGNTSCEQGQQFEALLQHICRECMAECQSALVCGIVSGAWVPEGRLFQDSKNAFWLP
jgi:hypothetical protein